MYKIILPLICSVFISTNLFAQLLNVSPAQNAVSVASSETIIIEFNEALTFDALNYVKVFGRWSGPAELGLSLSNDNKTMELLTDDFFAGEMIMVSLDRNLPFENGTQLGVPYTWYFWMKTAPGTLIQTLDETIELKVAGEDWLQTYGAYAGDLNNDGFSDLTAVNENTDDLRILLNDGQGYYPNMEIQTMGTSTPSPNEGADFNGDGEIDLAVCTVHDNEMRVLLGNGDGSFSAPTTYQTGNKARGLGILDSNSDGYDDIIVANRESSNLSLFVNDGNANFTTLTLDPDPNGDGESGLAVADANGDGIQDVFIGYYTSNEVGIFLGDGNNGFTLSDKVSVIGRPWMIATGDLNGDGHVDVASANSTQHRMSIIFGDGQGGLSDAVEYVEGNTIFPLAIDLGDIDGDGDLDIVTSNYDSGTFGVWENNSAGQFTLVDLLLAPANASCAILHDRDNDGDLDITATDETDDVILLFENTVVLNAPSIKENTFNVIATPNPFKEETVISYELNKAAFVNLSIFDASGKKLIELLNEKQESGQHQVRWNVKDANHSTIGAGIYFYTIKVGEKEYVGKLIKS